WAQDTKLADGTRVVAQEWVQMNLARVHTALEFLRLINWKVAWTATQGHLDVADASTIKVFGTEQYMTAIRLLSEIIGESAYLDRKAWQELANANLVGIAIPEAYGGSGLGFLEACLVLEQIGRNVAPVPYYASVVLGALPVATFGTEAQKQELLPPAAAGDLI